MSSESEQESSMPKGNFSRKRLLGEGSWVVANQLVSALTAIVGVRLLTEFLEPRVYGQMTLVLGLVGLGQLLSCSPFLQAAFRFYPEICSLPNGVSRLRSIIGKMLLYPSLGMVVALLLGGIFYPKIQYIAFVVLVFFFLIEQVRLLEQNLLSAARRQRALALWQMSYAILQPGLALLFVWLLGPQALSVYLGYFLCSAGLLFVLYIFSFPFEGQTSLADSSHFEEDVSATPFSQSGERSEAVPDESQAADSYEKSLTSQMLSYAVPLIPLGIVGWVHALGDRYMLGGLIGLREAGMYVAVYGLTQKPFMMVEGVLQQTLLPAYNQAISNNYEGEEQRIFRAWVFWVLVVSSFGCICFYFLGSWVVRICLAKAYWATAALMPWLAIGFAFLAIAHVFEWRLYSLKRTKLVLLGQSISAVSSIAIAVPMIYGWGLWGAALACPMYYAVYFLVMYLLGRKAIRQHYQSLK